MHYQLIIHLLLNNRITKIIIRKLMCTPGVHTIVLSVHPKKTVSKWQRISTINYNTTIQY